MSKWRIILYPHLHPKEPRAYGEMQPNNKRIYIFTKHKRHNKINMIESIYHEVIHLIFWVIFGKQYRSKFDEALDILSYNLSKQINRKKIVKEKGWNYFKGTKREKAYEFTS